MSMNNERLEDIHNSKNSSTYKVEVEVEVELQVELELKVEVRLNSTLLLVPSSRGRVFKQSSTSVPSSRPVPGSSQPPLGSCFSTLTIPAPRRSICIPSAQTRKFSVYSGVPAHG